MRDGANILRVVWSAMSAGLSAAYVEGAVASSSAEPITTNSVTAIPEGGTGPFTYAWAAVGTNGWTIGSPTSATTSFTSPATSPGVTKEAMFKCTISGPSGSAVTEHVTASVTNLGSGGPIE